jgi:hypothetical protein
MTTSVHSEAPATSEDLATEILRRRRKRLPLVTAALALAVAVGAGIVGGIEIQKHWGSSSSGSSAGGASSFASLRSQFASRFGSGGRGGFGGFGGAGAAGGSATVGTVTLIKGSTLYVTDASGNTVMVKTSPGSRVTKTVSGTIQTVHPGDTVTVVGQASSNGTVTASSIAVGNGS